MYLFLIVSHYLIFKSNKNTISYNLVILLTILQGGVLYDNTLDNKLETRFILRAQMKHGKIRNVVKL